MADDDVVIVPGEGAPPAAKPEDKVNTAIEALTRTTSLLTEGLARMQEQQGQILESLKPKEEPKPVHKTVTKENLFEGIEDVDSMTPAQAAQHVLEKLTGQFENRMSELMGKTEERVQRIADDFYTKDSKEQIDRLASANKDFFEWTNEIRATMKSHPSLSPSQAFNLAKSENPKKVSEMAKKYPAELKETKTRGFGLTPTSSRTTGTGKMSANEAAEKAFDEIFGGTTGFITDDARVG